MSTPILTGTHIVFHQEPRWAWASCGEEPQKAVRLISHAYAFTTGILAEMRNRGIENASIGISLGKTDDPAWVTSLIGVPDWSESRHQCRVVWIIPPVPVWFSKMFPDKVKHFENILPDDQAIEKVVGLMAQYLSKAPPKPK